MVAEAFGPDHVLALGRRQPVGNTVISPLIKCLGTGAASTTGLCSVSPRGRDLMVLRGSGGKCRQDVLATIREAFERYDVVRAYIDPQEWRSDIHARGGVR